MAISHYKNAIALANTGLNSKHADLTTVKALLTSHQHLAECFCQAGALGLAEFEFGYVYRALKACRERLGPGNPMTGSLLWGITQAYHHLLTHQQRYPHYVPQPIEADEQS